jgi:ATP-dependent Lon protease
MAPPEMIHIPDQLPVLPLPYPLVLHPSLLLSVPLSYAHSLSLLKAALQATQDPLRTSESAAKEGGDSQRPIIVACVPTLRVPPGSASQQAKPSSTRDVALSDEAEDTRVRINDLYDWGCAAKLVRLTRHPASQTCTLLVTGICRVRVDRWLSVRAPLTSTTLDRNITVPDIPVPLAAITTFTDDAPFPPYNASSSDIETANTLRHAAEDILDALTPLVATISRKPSEAVPATSTPTMPLLPPGLLRRIRTFIKDAREGQAGLVADVLVGTLGGACEWSERVSVLGEWDPRQRVKAAASVLSAGAARVRLARELLAALSAPLGGDTKESLARAQLETLLSQLAALNPNVTARISTGSSNFTIGPAIKSESGRGGNSRSNIVTIRAPSRGSSDDASAAPPRRAGAIKGPPGGGNGDSEEEDEVAELSKKLDAAMLTPEARKLCDRELKRLARIPQQSVERGVVITYLETMAELPWDKTSADLTPVLDEKAPKAITEAGEEGIVERARRILDEDHYGLEKIKKRLVEYLAVLELKTEQANERVAAEETQMREQKAQAAKEAKRQQKVSAPTEDDDEGEPEFKHLEDAAEEERRSNEATKEERRKRRKAHVADKGPILLLVGPPGTGKTSIAVSLACMQAFAVADPPFCSARSPLRCAGHSRVCRSAVFATRPKSVVTAGHTSA